ncbi:MAG TPA: NUDIX hydrolase [Desulfitobacteriaceae bacterium]|nr:NUDIX hydrolase [Desulfitobacteriaceae bacterium]
MAAFLPLLWKMRESNTLNDKSSGGLSAVVGIVQKDDNVLMVQRRNRYRTLSWQFPAGVLKPEEDMRDKVESEVANETGVHCKVKRYLGARVHDDTKVLCHYYFCIYLAGDAINLDEKENSQVTWVKAKDVTKYVTSSLYHEVEVLLGDVSQKMQKIKRVVLGVVLHNNRILLAQKIDDNQKPLWQLPGGTVENNETDENAIIREVFEETGITCSPSEKLGERIHPNTKQLISYWLCNYKTGQASVKEPEKFFSVLWVSKEDALPLLGNDLYEPIKQVLLK